MTTANSPIKKTEQEWQALTARLEQRIAKLEVLQEVARTLTSELELDRLLALILSSAVDVMQATAGSLLLYDSATNQLVFRVVHGGGGKAMRNKRISTDDGIAGWVFANQKPSIVNDAQLDARFLKGLDESFGFRTSSLIAVPLVHKGKSIGVIEVLNKKSGEHFGADDQELLYAFAAQSGVAIENARLYHQVVAERDRILAVEEEVRRQLARELHDGPSQLLSAIIMGLRFLKEVIVRQPERTQDELVELERQATQALHQVRNMLFDLRPVALETQGLCAAMQIYVERQNDTKDTTLHLDTQSFTARFPPKVEGAVFSIVQEAVGNAKKHAQAKNIWISAHQEEGKLVIGVKDDGRGFDLHQVEGAYAQRGNLGLLNMKERSELANAKLTIDSTPGKGTAVTLILRMHDAINNETPDPHLA